MAFLEHVDRFMGTGQKNKAGQELRDFLNKYDPKKYDCPSNTTDIIVVRCKERLVRWGQPLKLLMVKRSNHPSIGFWALPGGFVELREDLYEGAKRELEEETGVKGLPLKQLTTWGKYDRDPRWRVITTSFLALVEGDIPVKAGDDAADAAWLDVKLEKAETEDGTLKDEIWLLKLLQKERDLELSAKIRVRKTGHPLVSQEDYEILSCFGRERTEKSGIAVDHGCLILQALLYLKSELES